MTTLNEMLAIIRAENPDGLRIGDDQQGYTPLSPADYEATLTEWAKARLDRQARTATAAAVVEAKKQAVIKLTELGIDPKAFDLEAALSTPMVTVDEAETI